MPGNRPLHFVLAAILSVSLGIAALAWAAEPGETSPEPSNPPEGMTLPEYNDDGALLRPVGYERWTLVGTSLGLDYSPGREPDPERPGMFHNVYLQPEAFDYYVEQGEFPEQAVFVVTNNPPVKRKGDDEINRRGHFAANPTGLEVSVKDSKRFDDGWGYFMYYSVGGPRTPSKPHARAACYDCHAEHGEDDAVFVQFYSVLKNAREERLKKRP